MKNLLFHERVVSGDIFQDCQFNPVLVMATTEYLLSLGGC